VRPRLFGADVPVAAGLPDSQGSAATRHDAAIGRASPLRVMQVLDTLDAGGQERFAVYLANLLPRSRYHSHLCTTRYEGALSDLIAGDVGRLRLGRNWRYDVPAVLRMAAYIQDHRIDILHAHFDAVFVSVLASMLPPYPS